MQETPQPVEGGRYVNTYGKRMTVLVVDEFDIPGRDLPFAVVAYRCDGSERVHMRPAAAIKGWRRCG